MADIIMSQKGTRRSRARIHIDFTPMVDLGFLLITFFIVTTTLANPRVLQVTMPSTEKTDNPTVFPESATVTLIPTSGHRVYYFSGSLNNTTDLTLLPINKVRDLLTKKKKLVASQHQITSNQGIYLLIKPEEHSTYDDLIQLIDEATIADARNFAITDLTINEFKYVKALAK